MTRSFKLPDTLLVLFSLPWLAYAKLPFSTTDFRHPLLKAADSISFDPLAIIAILWNPRASASASRLYSQPHAKFFRWPHMMQIGAVTVPVSVLVSHLTSNFKSIHPSVEMFLVDVNKLKVKSTISGAINLFTSLLVSGSESVLAEALNFRPSEYPANDIVVVALGSTAGGYSDTNGPARAAAKVIALLTELFMGLFVACGLVFSILMGEMWAIALFGTYLLHWIASTVLVSFPMIIPDPGLRILPDSKKVYAVYERPSGGWVVFKGAQQTMERWARTSWTFQDTSFRRTLHWFWIMTGTLAALASVASMVNMDGRLQLGFLGLLLYGSAAEIWLTVLYQKVQPDDISYLGSCNTCAVHASSIVNSNAGGNDKKYKSIIQAGLGIDSLYRLEKLSWTGLGLLPPRPPFTTLEETIDTLNERAEANGDIPTEEHLAAALQEYNEKCENHKVGESGVKKGIEDEIKRVWRKRIEEFQSSTNISTTDVEIK